MPPSPCTADGRERQQVVREREVPGNPLGVALEPEAQEFVDASFISELDKSGFIKKLYEGK